MENYKIISEKSLGELSIVVNKFISNGYIPIGGVSVSIPGNYIQALVKAIISLSAETETQLNS